MHPRALAALVSAVVAAGTARAASITGEVVDGQGAPVAAARVRLQGTAVATTTDERGRFQLPLSGAPPAAVAAWKEGYFNGGAPVVSDRARYRIVLAPLPREEPAPRAWISARGSSPEACARCHPSLTGEWEGSAHARAATNPLFLAVYEGKDRRGLPTEGPAYRRDFPQAAGNCATCHVPALALESPFGADPRRATGPGAEGVFCDLCHKVKAAAVDQTGGRPGVLSLALLRPGRGQLFFGPLDDVVGRPDSFLPLFRQSQFCAPCHQGRAWNVPAYSEFQEWAGSDYARRNIQCQDCHMRAAPGAPRRFALEQAGGILRDPTTLSSHGLAGPGDAELMRAAVELGAQAALASDGLRVQVAVRNAGAGHHLPTGSPMRNILLVVEVADARGVLLPQRAGERIPDWAGRGAPEKGDLGGLPGRGFAKVLADLVEYPADRGRGRNFAAAFPAPHWRPTVVASDTRIPAGATDRSEYRFDVAQAAWPLQVRARLVYRRTFRSWGRLAALAGDDLLLAVSETSVDRPAAVGRGGEQP